MRPGSLLEVADRTRVDADWQRHLDEFLDAFYGRDLELAAQSSMIEDDPGMTGTQSVDAFLGGAGEHLARRWKLRIPRWVADPRRYLDSPIFVPSSEATRPLLLVVTPVAFRTRLVFTGPDPLQRARFPYRRGVNGFPDSRGVRSTCNSPG